MNPDLTVAAWTIRARLDQIWAADTRAPGFGDDPPSSGHCAVVAMLVHELMGGEIKAVSLLRRDWDSLDRCAESAPHWFNEVPFSTLGNVGPLYLDLTQDQFTFSRRGIVRLVSWSHPYPDHRARRVNPERYRQSGLGRRFAILRERFLATSA